MGSNPSVRSRPSTWRRMDSSVPSPTAVASSRHRQMNTTVNLFIARTPSDLSQSSVVPTVHVYLDGKAGCGARHAASMFRAFHAHIPRYTSILIACLTPLYRPCIILSRLACGLTIELGFVKSGITTVCRLQRKAGQAVSIPNSQFPISNSPQHSRIRIHSGIKESGIRGVRLRFPILEC